MLSEEWIFEVLYFKFKILVNISFSNSRIKRYASIYDICPKGKFLKNNLCNN